MANKRKPRTHTLSIFLLKKKIKKSTDAIKPDAMLQQQQFALGGGVNVELHTRRTHAPKPRWARYFDGTAADLAQLRSESACGLLFVPIKNRLFAIAFGHGRHDLEAGCWEDSFGLKVTANAIDEKKIRSIDSKTFEAITRHTRTQISHEGETFSFGLDTERDLLRALTGAPRDAKHGVRLSGLDSLTATVRAELDDLPELLEGYLQQFASKAYQQHFSWIDHVGEVRNPAELKQATDRLEKELRQWSQNAGAKLWLVAPDIVDWQASGQFTYQGKSGPRHDDLHLAEFLQTLDDLPSLTVETLKKRKVTLWDAEGEHQQSVWSAYACLYAELDINGKTYLLTSGSWYRIEPDFAKAVKQEVKALVTTSPKLPAYADKNEGEYNKRVAGKAATYANMDKDNIMFGGGRSRFEFCDLLSHSKDMIHVKRYGGSAPLSHLFSQGAHAAQLWMADPEFRTAVAAKLPKKYRPAQPKDRPKGDEYRIVYAVVSNSKTPIDESLPFFSCLSLRNAARSIRSFGMRVALVKIEC